MKLVLIVIALACTACSSAEVMKDCKQIDSVFWICEAP